MTTPEPSDGEVVLITSIHPLTPESLKNIEKYVASRLAAGQPIILDHGLDMQVRRVLPTILKSEHYARVDELLNTTNRYLERYRKAEAKLREIGVAP